jgi:hypothetical protein
MSVFEVFTKLLVTKNFKFDKTSNGSSAKKNNTIIIQAS